MMDISTLIRQGAPYDFLFFWGHQMTYGLITKSCLSQWYPSKFTENGTEYCCCEQYMMAAKAHIMGDIAMLQRIMISTDPKIIKSLGKKVRNFDSVLWDKHKREIVIRGNMLKFGQNPELKQFLLDTGDKILVEASPYDIIWGIGLEEKDPKAADPRQWRGSNLLGFALMEVRDRLRQQ